MIIPLEHISPEAQQGLIEAFIMREGTDYGAYEVELSDKVRQVRQSLQVGEALIIYDATTESTTIMTRQQYQEWVSR